MSYKLQAASYKLQAASCELQAASCERQASFEGRLARELKRIISLGVDAQVEQASGIVRRTIVVGRHSKLQLAVWAEFSRHS